MAVTAARTDQAVAEVLLISCRTAHDDVDDFVTDWATAQAVAEVAVTGVVPGSGWTIACDGTGDDRTVVRVTIDVVPRLPDP